MGRRVFWKTCGARGAVVHVVQVGPRGPMHRVHQRFLKQLSRDEGPVLEDLVQRAGFKRKRPRGGVSFELRHSDPEGLRRRGEKSRRMACFGVTLRSPARRADIHEESMPSTRKARS